MGWRWAHWSQEMMNEQPAMPSGLPERTVPRNTFKGRCQLFRTLQSFSSGFPETKHEGFEVGCPHHSSWSENYFHCPPPHLNGVVSFERNPLTASHPLGPEREREKRWQLRREPPVAVATCSNFLHKTAFIVWTEIGVCEQAYTLKNGVRKAKPDILKTAEDNEKLGRTNKKLFIVSLPAEWSHNSVSVFAVVIIKCIN